MGKRMTETEKWRDRWFRGLPPTQKLAYLYLLDLCDNAGTIELDEDLAEFQIGTAPDWEGLIASSEGRIERLESGRLWLTKFVAYQCGLPLSLDCNAHKAVVRAAEKAGLPDGLIKGWLTLPEGSTKGSASAQDLDKDKNKKPKKNNAGQSVGEWDFPDGFDTPATRAALDEFEAHRREIGKPVKNRANTSKVFKRFDDAEHLIYAIETVVANGWQGIKPDYRPPRKSKNNSSRVRSKSKEEIAKIQVETCDE